MTNNLNEEQENKQNTFQRFEDFARNLMAVSNREIQEKNIQNKAKKKQEESR